VWVSGSATGFYGDRGQEEVDETTGPGTSFLARVVQQWEYATRGAADATRVVLARTGIVLGKEGALKPLSTATGFGLGSRIGSGTQWWPWISMADEVGAIIFALTSTLVGPVNMVAPHPATAEEISRTLAKTMNRPHALVLPSLLTKTVMAGADELLLSSQKVKPTALVRAGFRFTQPTLAQAIQELIASGSVGRQKL
jgi:uncharacterized protein (TIGR01777 family)